MTNKLGRGPLGSLKARVKAEVAELFSGNRTITHARYPWFRRAFNAWIVDRELGEMVGV